MSTTHDPSRRRRALRLGTLTLVAALSATTVGLLPSAPASAATTSYAATGRVSVPTTGPAIAQALGNLSFIDQTGRFAAFTSTAALDPADSNASGDAYIRDRVAGTTERVSLTDADGQISGDSEACGMSGDGRFVAFAGRGGGLPTPLVKQIYLRDRVLRTTQMVTVSSAEAPSAASGGYYACPVSDNGRYVTFVSNDPLLAPGDANGTLNDVFRRDLMGGVTDRASVSTAGAKANSAAQQPAMSADGSVVAFTSNATNLINSDTNSTEDVFVRSFATSQTTRVSEQTNGTQTTSWSVEPSLSADGNRVAFLSHDPNLVGGDTNGKEDIFVRNRSANTLLRASLTGLANQMPGASARPSLSDDGLTVSFSYDTDAVIPGDDNETFDIYRRDLSGVTTQLISVAKGGGASNGGADYSALSGDGTAVAFRSASTDLVRKDQNGSPDVFVRELIEPLDPFGTQAALIKQQFTDFEGRQPTSAELTEWTARLANGETNPDLLIDALAHGSTFAGKRAPMIRLYWAFFLRAPDQDGLQFWTSRLQSGWTLARVAKQFAASSEFQTKYGSKTNAEFVTLIYQNIFDRDPDAGGLAYWTGKLDAKTKTRGDVMVNFSESSEGRRDLAPQTDTILHFLGMLRTMPSKVYLDLMLDSLKGPWISAAQVATLRGSSTYGLRITP